MKNIKIFLILATAILLYSKTAYSQGISSVFEYYNMVSETLVKAGDKAASNEFTQFLETVTTRASNYQSQDRGFFDKNDPDYVKDMVDNILSQKGGHLNSWGTISSALKTFNNTYDFVSISSSIKNIGITAKQWNKVVKQLGESVARGNNSWLQWTLAIAETGYYSGKILDDITGIGDDTADILEALIKDKSASELSEIMNGLQEASSIYSAIEYSNMALTDAGKKVLVQNIAIQFLLEEDLRTSSVDELKTQNLYTAVFVDRIWPVPNTYKEEIKLGSEVYKEVVIEYVDNTDYFQPIEEDTNTDLTDENNIDLGDNQSPTPDDESDTNPGDDDLATLPNLGYVAGKASGSTSLFTSNLYTGLEGGGDAPIGSRGEARLNRGGTSTLYSDGINPDIQVQVNSSISQDGYSYSDWGEWNGAGKTLPTLSNAQAERGFWVIGEATHRDNLPTGTATYNGEVQGVGFNGETIGGSVSLNANFGTQTLNGSLDLTRQNGSNWIKLETGDMSYTTGHEYGITFSNTNASVKTPAGATIGGAGANTSGMFVGPEGEEVIGDWAVWNVPDAVGGADGVYRAKK